MTKVSSKLNVKEIVIFGIYGALMFASKTVMAVLPNIHLLGVFIIALTLVYRKKALFPIYVYVFVDGFFGGFDAWWVPYLYVWAILWGMTMLLPKRIPKKIAPIVYMVLCALHGFAFGIIYAPAQALLFGFDFKTTVAWVITGLPFDFIHGVSNFFCAALVCPLVSLMRKLEKYT